MKLLVVFAALALWLPAQNPADIVLLPPSTSGGKPLLQALRERKSARDFSPAEIPPRILSDLLWAAAGINREDGGRTAPTAHGKQEVEVFVALKQGLYLYEPKPHRLRLIAAGDRRADTGTQDFVAAAPLNLVYVADLAKMAPSSPEDKLIYSATDVGFISQNVYLYCASEGLATVARSSVNRKALAESLRLGPDRVAVLAQSVGFPKQASAARVQPRIRDAWEPQPARAAGGVLGERLKMWRERRLTRLEADPVLLKPFEGGSGSHSQQALVSGRAGQGESPGSSPLWQGEHIGKWLHAASLAYEQSRDEKLLQMLRESVRRLVAAQQPDGYLGTYAPGKRFYAPPDADTWRSWDIWTQRYNLYGLLTYDRFHPTPAAVQASIRIGDLLLETFGPGKRDMTQIGTRHGMSSGTLLESIVMLYERSGERRFLDFARHIVRMSEDNPKYRLLGAMLAREDVSGPGDGKAYQLMAVLLGYGELYRFTGEPQWKTALANGWENIRAGHLHESGGPWSFAHVPVKNKECFAPPELFDPAHPVEVCSATTWVQLCLQLLRITGEARYAAEAERAVLNQILGSQSSDGVSWATHPEANTKDRKYISTVNCCASSGPRALEMFSAHLAGTAGDAVSIASYVPASIDVPARGLKIRIAGDYPFEARAGIAFELKAPVSFPVDFAPPFGVNEPRVAVNGRAQKLERQPSGFYRLRRMWSPGERIEVSFDFAVAAHIRQGRGGKRWVAFTRGPIALAAESPYELPDGRNPASLVKGDRLGDGPRLLPFYRAGNPGGPVYTYFSLR